MHRNFSFLIFELFQINSFKIRFLWHLKIFKFKGEKNLTRFWFFLSLISKSPYWNFLSKINKSDLYYYTFMNLKFHLKFIIRFENNWIEIYL